MHGLPLRQAGQDQRECRHDQEMERRRAIKAMPSLPGLLRPGRPICRRCRLAQSPRCHKTPLAWLLHHRRLVTHPRRRRRRRRTLRVQVSAGSGHPPAPTSAQWPATLTVPVTLTVPATQTVPTTLTLPSPKATSPPDPPPPTLPPHRFPLSMQLHHHSQGIPQTHPPQRPLTRNPAPPGPLPATTHRSR